MDGFLVHRFLAEHGRSLAGASVRRAVPLAQGLALALETQDASWELGFLGVGRVAWAWCLGRDARERLHAEVAPLLPSLISPAPKGLGLRAEDATCLDALRAWMMRPVAALQPGWAHLEGARLERLEPRGLDRVLVLDFETQDALGRRDRSRLVAELFGRAVNLILANESGSELANLRGRRPAPERSEATRALPSLERLREVMLLEYPVRTLAEEMPGIGGEMARLALASAAGDADRLAAWLERFAAQRDSAPLIWMSESGASLQLDPASEIESRISLAAAAHLDFSLAGAGELQADAHRLFSRQESRLRSLLAKLEDEERAAGEAGRWRQMGELLSANLHRVRRGQSRITVEDFHAEGEPRDIDLDPKLSPQENVALFFKRARRGERGLSTIAARRAAVCTALDASRAAHVGTEPRRDWADALEAWPEVWRTSGPKATEKLTPRALWAPGGPEWGAPSRGRRASEVQEKSHGPGRRYLLPGGWEVRVGRSNAENDELTHHFAAADDVWMHASGAAGSHVVLRMAGRPGNPPREILEAAAAIAARFSKAKHSGTVPVIWTRKRHVRKPRGSKPGLASCTNEKTLFVRPGLPPAHDESES